MIYIPFAEGGFCHSPTRPKLDARTGFEPAKYEGCNLAHLATLAPGVKKILCCQDIVRRFTKNWLIMAK